MSQFSSATAENRQRSPARNDGICPALAILRSVLVLIFSTFAASSVVRTVSFVFGSTVGMCLVLVDLDLLHTVQDVN